MNKFMYVLFFLFLSSHSAANEVTERVLHVNNMRVGPYLAAIYEGDFDTVESAMNNGLLLDLSLIHQAYIVGFESYHKSCLNDSNSITLEAKIERNGFSNTIEYRMKSRFGKKFKQYFNAGDYGLNGRDGAAALFGVKTPRAEIIDFVSTHSCTSEILNHFEENLYRASQGIEASELNVKSETPQEDTTSSSGLIFTSIHEGVGAYPTVRDTVLAHYQGTLLDGTIFDSSIERGEPLLFPLSAVIPCWTEGVQMIRVGGKAKLVCPADIAYGKKGVGAVIPGGATLIFEIELLNIE